MILYLDIFGSLCSKMNLLLSLILSFRMRNKPTVCTSVVKCLICTVRMFGAFRFDVLEVAIQRPSHLYCIVSHLTLILHTKSIKFKKEKKIQFSRTRNRTTKRHRRNRTIPILLKQNFEAEFNNSRKKKSASLDLNRLHRGLLFKY